MGNLLQVVVRSFAGRCQQLLGLPMHAQTRESITPRLTINNLMTHGALDSFFELKELDWRLALHPRGTAEIVEPMTALIEQFTECCSFERPSTPVITTTPLMQRS